MAADSRTQIILAVIGLVGVLGAAAIANWPKSNPNPKPHEGTFGEVSTTCKYSSGPKSGQTQFFPPDSPGLTPGRVGYSCTDGMGSSGVGVPNAE